MLAKYPAIIIPFTNADADLDPVYESFVPLSDEDKKAQSLCESLRASLAFEMGY